MEVRRKVKIRIKKINLIKKRKRKNTKNVGRKVISYEEDILIIKR
jgi:hypothetical protein